MQNERDARREAYEDARRKETFKRRRNFLSDDMLGKWRFLELVIEERGGSEDILKVKAARTARRLKGLTLRFWKRDDVSYQYQIENMMTKSHGTYSTGADQREDKPSTASNSVLSDLWLTYIGSPGIQFHKRRIHRAGTVTGDGEVFTTQYTLTTRYREGSL